MLDVGVDGIKFAVKFTVMDISVPFILGRDAIRGLRGEINYDDDTVKFRTDQGSATVQMHDGSEGFSGRAVYCTDVIQKCAELRNEGHVAIASVVEEFQDLFAETLGDIPGVKDYEYRIEVMDEARQSPIFTRMRKLAPREKECMFQQVNDLLRAKMIVPSKSEWSSPVVFVP
jgi:hypothetical protein